MHPSIGLTNRARDVGLIYLVTLKAFVQMTCYPYGSERTLFGKQLDRIEHIGRYEDL